MSTQTIEKTVQPAPNHAVCASDSESVKAIEPSRAKTVAGGCLSVVVLGASGDLAKKKTFPAIFNLYKQVLMGSQMMYCILSSVMSLFAWTPFLGLVQCGQRSWQLFVEM